jgi:hypothetical protein
MFFDGGVGCLWGSVVAVCICCVEKVGLVCLKLYEKFLFLVG